MVMKALRVSMMVVLAGMVIFAGAEARADGMIVPVRPDIRVRGSWAVKYHHVNITVRDQVAAVGIDQEFVNTGRGMIEVEYLFPVPPGAAIDSMTLVVDGKEFAAKLLKADEARKIYEDIVRKKKDPALLEYAGFGLYKTRAFPLRPGKPCKVIVTYKSVCRKDHDLVEVWYPLNTEKFSAKAIESVRVKVDIKSKADIGPVYSPTHSLTVERKAPNHAIATYQVKKALPTTDFQLFYKAANENIGATLITHQGDPKTDGHFMMLVSPNPRIAGSAVVAKNVVLVFDHSGSMSDKKIDQAKAAMRYTLKNLNSEDNFNVVAYNDSVETFFGTMVAANKEKITVALDMVDRLEATGGTNIHEALQKAMKLLNECKSKGKRPGYVIFLTDGQPTVGKVETKDILYETKQANKTNARIFAFGVGYQPNVRLLDKLALDNKGRSDYVKPGEPIEAKVSSLYNKIKNPVMTSLKVDLHGIKLKDMYPRQLGDLFDGDQIVVVGRYNCQGAEKRTTLVIKGVYQGKERAFEYNVVVRPPGKDMRYVFAEKIWAVRRVGYLMDQIQLSGKSKEVIDELIRLSKKYGIMTPYTSFLADETTRLHRPAEVRAKGAATAGGLARSTDGFRGQRDAKMRQELNDAVTMAESSAPAAPGVGGGEGQGRGGGVRMFGKAKRRNYEGDKYEYVRGMRNVGNTSLYRRGRLWIASSASKLDPKKDSGKIETVERFSKKYFELIRRNTVAQNQVLASQQDNEEMLIVLRNQAYRIK